ncbi:MAG: FxsA family protein [Arcobacter butzleri]|nr:FxsA family protein [Aliarcobacter butzleri]
MFIIYLLLYLFFEVLISTSIASSLGGVLTFVEIIFSAVLGMYIIKNMNTSIAYSLQKLRQKEITQEEFSKINLASFIGAVLLIVQGFLTDIIGLLLQLNFIANIVFSKIIIKDSNSYYSYSKTYKKEGENDVIEAEIIEYSDTTNK